MGMRRKRRGLMPNPLSGQARRFPDPRREASGST